MLVCNLLNSLSQPFATECTNNTLREGDELLGTEGSVGMSVINGMALKRIVRRKQPWYGQL